MEGWVGLGFWRYARGPALGFLVISIIFFTQSSIIPRDAAQPTPANTASFANPTLTNGYACYYQVSAARIVGEGQRSLEFLATPLASNVTAPSAVRNLTEVAGNGQVNLTWEPPLSDGGEPIYYYWIQTYPPTYDNGSFDAVFGGITNWTDTTVSNGQTYEFNVTAVNLAYLAGPTVTIFATPSGIPTPPTAPQYPYAYASNAQVQLYWGAPTHFGGAPITNYTIYKGTSSGGETFLANVNSSNRYYLDTAVINGVTYYYQYSAWNSVGQGPRSAEASATPNLPPGPPSAPRNLTATAGNGNVTLHWLASLSNGGAPIYVYYIYRSTVSGGETYFNGSYSYSTNFNDTGLTNDQTYYYRVLASNGYGYSPYSNEVSVTPFAPHTPSAPQNIISIAGNRTVTLAWSPPHDSGGYPVTHYMVLRTTPGASAGSYFEINSGTAFTDTGLVNGQTYDYSIGAVNKLGLGIFANISATPIAPTVPVALPPSTPTGVGLITNATISNFNYNQAEGTFTFTVTGGAPSSIGVANITLPKSLVGSNTNITIYIDGKPVTNAQLFFDANNYYVYFTFHFSTHSVSITLGALTTSPTGTSVTIDLLLIGVLVIGIVIGATAASLMSRRRQSTVKIPSPMTA